MSDGQVINDTKKYHMVPLVGMVRYNTILIIISDPQNAGR